jgi:hypothetical protein
MSRKPTCRACCTAQHEGETEDDCDECPFLATGTEGRELLSIYNLATEIYKDPKSKIKSTSISPDRLRLAFEVYNVVDKEKCFRYVARAVNVTNGEI